MPRPTKDGASRRASQSTNFVSASPLASVTSVANHTSTLNAVEWPTICSHETTPSPTISTTTIMAVTTGSMWCAAPTHMPRAPRISASSTHSLRLIGPIAVSWSAAQRGAAGASLISGG